VLTIDPFEIRTRAGQRAWRQLLLGIERDLVLAGSWRGMIARDLAEYVFTRSSGHFASLMSLVSRGCYRAVRTGAESLTAAVLDAVRIDQAAEDARGQLRAAIEAGVPPAPARAGATGRRRPGERGMTVRLPFTLTPLDGEPLEVWLHAYAARLTMSAGDLAGALGMPLRRDHGRAAEPSPSQVAAVCAATCLAPSAVTAMSTTAGPVPSPRLLLAWMPQRTTRFCPACLAEDPGQMPAAWCLPVTFFCLRHGQLLAACCPRCGRTPAGPGPAVPGRALRRPGRLRRPARRRQPAGLR